MGREQNNIYIFISDENRKYYRAVQQPNGDWTITKNALPYPIKHTPLNLLETEIEFATNTNYFSLNRSISYPLSFIKDGAAILRSLYFLGKGAEQKAYMKILEWNGNTGIYELSYEGKFDFAQKEEDPKAGIFTVPVVDDSCWGLLSRYDDVDFAIDCSRNNPKAIRVLFDGITLLNRYTFQTVQASIRKFYDSYNGVTIPFVKINEDGDSSGIISKSQTSFTFTETSLNYTKNANSHFFETQYDINGVRIYGSFNFIAYRRMIPGYGQLTVKFITNIGRSHTIFTNRDITPQFYIDLGVTYKINFDFQWDLYAGEKVFFIAEFYEIQLVGDFQITPVVTNITIEAKTKSEPQIAYGLRPLDLLKEIVSLATQGRYSINSNFFAENNKSICFGGDSIRDFPNAKIYTSFKDFFKSFNAKNFMALRNVEGSLWMEKATEVYKTGTTLIDLGDIVDLKLSAASEYYANEIEVGSPKVDYRHPSGRLEFNSTNTFSMPVLNTQKKLDFVSKYRMGCYDIQFLIMDYKGGSTKDNSGDNNVYIAEITDEQAAARDNIETFENITIDNALLQPVIKTPFGGDVITYNKPRLSGVGIPLNPVNIYVDTVLDGSTSCNANGEWFYDIVTALESYEFGVSTGIHIIDSTYTDLAAPTSTVTVTINTTLTTATDVVYPNDGDSLYNNKPRIYGIAQQGTSVNVIIDGVTVGTVVADGSCRWYYNSGVIPNGNHTIRANSSQSNNFNVDTRVEFPLITYIGSELDGVVIPNNLPLIKGVALPNTIVELWLNYVNVKLGEAISDSNGNWEFQVVPVSYIDQGSGTSITLAPIRNGLSVVSTSLVNHVVAIDIKGYKLSRPAYSSITGVIDNTVFNTEMSPKRMLQAHYPMLSAILNKQTTESINFQTADKNRNLATTLNGVSVVESDDVPVFSLGKPIALLEYANITTKTNKTFAKLLYDFNQGGVIKANFRGNDIFMLPIGSMKISNVMSRVQDWKLLMSPDMSYQTLLNLYKNGLIIRIMRNSLYHSDYNSLHFVSYNYQQPLEFNHTSYYNDWFNNRNSAWVLNPDYIQKFQRTETIIDQIIVNGLTDVKLDVHNCEDGSFLFSSTYEPVVNQPISGPDIVMETEINMSTLGDGQFFFVLTVAGVPVCISERIEVKLKHEKTILIEASNSINQTGFFFSTGAKTILRVEGLVKKLQPDITAVSAKEESGNTELLYSMISKKRTIRFGNAYGLPDYLYLKVANALLCDELNIEGSYYSLGQDEKINPSDDVDGHPLYYYNVNLTLNTNQKGKTFGVDVTSDTEGVVIVLDATAFGLPSGSLINISLD